MTFMRTFFAGTTLLLLAFFALAQTPENKHFTKDGLSFDYPANWQLSDQSTTQMQLIELTRGDLVIRVRSPREWLKTPEKEAHARKLFQDKYLEDFASQVEQAGMHPKRSTGVIQIGGGEAQGGTVKAVMDGLPGGMESYSRMISDRLVNLSIIGSDKDIAKATAWETIRSSLQVEAAPLPKPSPLPSPKTQP